MKRILLLLAIYARRSFLVWWAFRSFVFTLIVHQAVPPLLGLAVWNAAATGQPSISTYYVALLAVQLLTSSQEYYSVSLRIYDGSLGMDLLKPHAVVIDTIGESIAGRTWYFLLGLPFIALGTMLTGASFQLVDILASLPALLFAAVLRFLFVYILALSALWVEQAGEVTEFGSTLIFLLGGLAIPIVLFPASVRPIVEILPFRAMLGFPAEIASGQLSVEQMLVGYGWQLGWMAVLIPLAMIVWTTGIRRYTALGG